MKNNKILIALLSGLLAFSSCSDWLDQKDLNSMSGSQVYSSDIGISGISSNLYSRLPMYQNFSSDIDLMDKCRWDEAINTSQYWSNAGNVGQGYRNFYDYGLIREINIHIAELEKNQGGGVPQENMKYYLAEARFMRAYCYFILAAQMGGVPIITEVQEYTENPLDLARPRNKESEVYDFIYNEISEIKEDLELKAATLTNTRATKGGALALQCRAMLYAGTLANNFDKSAVKGVNKPSGVTGIDKAKANDYLQKCIDAAIEIESLGKYRLSFADASTPNYANNYYELFLKNQNNTEFIFCKAYDGTNVFNDFTRRSLPRSQTSASKAGAEINPVLNLVNCYEVVSTKQIKEIDAYAGTEEVEDIRVNTSSYVYNIYEKPEDIFAGRDPRLEGTVAYPGSSVRGKQVDLKAGLAVLESDGSYTFRSAESITKISTDEYNGVKLTGEDGPFRGGDGNWYISHSGFLMKKFIDSNTGSEGEGMSTVPYVIFRLGEVYLNASEAAFLLSQNGVAAYAGQDTKTMSLTYINKVRNRAAGSSFELTASELDYNRIMNERRIELAFEDHRYYDLKRWRIADEIWNNQRDSETAVVFGLWPYQVYAPGDASDGKWIYRKVRLQHRGSIEDPAPINFGRNMYYATYPMDKGNPLIEANPYQ